MVFARRAFALLLTLAVLSVTIALATIAARYVYQAKQKADDVSMHIQANILYADIKRAFKRMGGNGAFRTNLYTAPLPLFAPNGRFSLLLRCRPDGDRININWLVFDGNQTLQPYADATRKVLERITVRYESENPERFLDELAHLVVPRLQGDTSELLQNYGTITYQRFSVFLDRYELRTGDRFATKVPWREIFLFEPLYKGRKPSKLAANYLQKETVSLLYDIDPALTETLWQPGAKKLDRFLQETGTENVWQSIMSDSLPKSSYCDATLVYKGQPFSFEIYEQNAEVRRLVFKK